MPYLPSNPQNHNDGGTLELEGVASITSADVGGFRYVFVAGGVDDGVSVFRLNANGTLTPIFDVTDLGALELDGARCVTTAMVDGNTYLFVSGASDDGVSVFRVNTNGSLTNVHNVTDADPLLLDGADAMATVRVASGTYLFVAGELDNGISTFRVAGDGRLTSIANTADAGALELAGVRGLTTAIVGGTAFLIAGGTDDGVSVFSINATTGALTNTANVNDTVGVNLQDVSDITTAVINGTTYVFIAGQADNGVSVYSLSGAGLLTHVDSETDTAASLIAGANSVSVTTIGSTTYLMVGGNESGFSLYRIETGANNSTAGSLTFVHSVADAGTLELSGQNSVHGATINGTTYLIGGGGTDNGVSTLGSTTTGQIWYSTEGNTSDARISYFNTDGGLHTSLFDNTPSIDLTTGFVEAVAIDSAAGFYFALVTGNEGLNARLIRGQIGSSTAPTVVYTFDQSFVLLSEDNLVFHLDIDTINERLYLGYVEFNADVGGADTFGPATQGVLQFTYNPLTGAVTGSNSSFLVTDTTANIPPSTAGADSIFAARDMTFDTTNNVFYTSSLALGDGFETNVISRFSLSAPTGAAAVSVVNPTFFALNGDGSDFTTSNGIVADIEVDENSNRLYILARSEDVEEGGTEDSLYVVFNASTASNVTPTEVVLSGTVGSFTFSYANFYPGDMTLDEVNNILYIESENSNLVGGGAADQDVILVFQLASDSLTGTLINVIDMEFITTASVEGMHFNYLADLGTLTATGTAAVEQSVAVDLLNGAPAISDFDGDHLASATVRITGGTFNSNENSFDDDDLGYTSAMTQSGLIAGTNITISWDQATGTLTLTGYDTFANYQAALNAIHFRSTGDNPTNYGLNTFRTLTWTISDGLPNIPGGAENSGTTTVNITGDNDDITHNGISDRVMSEDTPLYVSGLSITDPDLNPAITDITVTFTATNGTVSLLDNVAGGLTAADIADNGTGLVTVTATLNEINATLAAMNGLLFTNTPDFNGSGSLLIQSSDGGNTGPNGTSPQTDADTITITINAVVDIANDNATTNEDTAVNVLVFANDTFEATDEAIQSFTQGANGTVTLNDNGTALDTTDDFLVYTPIADFNGTDSFQYTVLSGGVTETATVNITINAVADIVDDNATTNEDTAVNILVQANDTFENPVHSIQSFTQGANGTVTLNNNGTAGDTTDDFLVYTANADFNGSDSFTYTILSGGVTETATVNVTINAVADIADDNVTVDEDSGANALNLYANDSFENPGRSITAVTQGTNGTVAINNNGTAGDTSDDFVTYTPTANFNGTDTFTYTVTSGGVTETATVNVTVGAVNDPVTGTAPASLLLNEDATNVAVAGLSISDVDSVLAPAGVYDVTLSASNGTLTLTTLTGLTFTTGDGTGDTTMTFHGTLADINAALATATYTPDANFNGPATITLNVTDTFGGIVATGTGAATSDTDIVNVTVTAINDTPVVAVVASVNSTEQVAGLIDATATIADVELGARNGGNGDYGNSSLTVGRNGGAAAEDLLNFAASGAFTVDGSNLKAGGLIFATFTGGNGSNLVINFTSLEAPATSALVNAVIQAIQYTYTGDTPPASIVMNYSFNDGAPGNALQGGGGSPTGTDAVTINITDTPENSPPTLDLDADDSNAVGTGYAASFTEGGAAVLIADTDVLITDADAGDNIESATIAIQSPVAGDLLTAGTLPAGISVDLLNSTATTLVLTGTGSAADYAAAIEAISFTNTSEDPGASRTINVVVNDGTDDSAAAVATITITEINDEPTLVATGGTPTFTEGGAAVDLFSAVTASTVEAGQTFTSMTLTVTNVDNPGSEVLVIDGSDVAINNGNAVVTSGNGLLVNVTMTGSTATLTFIGAALSPAALNAIIDAITYRNLSDNPSDADRVITITELVDSGANGGADDNISTPNIAATVNVDPVNDPPVNVVPGTQTINEDGSVTLSTGNGNAISVSDADATTLSVTLTVQHGTLTLASTTGLSFGAGDGTGDPTMTFSGTAAAINAALGSGLTYNPNADFNGSDAISVQTTDNGQTGGPAQTDTDPVTVNITAINDAPIVAGDGTEQAADINEDTPTGGQTIQALFSGQYSDQADNQIPNGGASSPGQFSGIAITANGSSVATGQWQYFNGAVWVDIGPASDSAAVLLGSPFTTLIRFNPVLDFYGDAPTLTVHLIDNSLPFGITNGQIVDLSGMGATGGTTAYSTGTVVLSQYVIPDNFQPIVDLNGAGAGNDYTTTFVEDGTAVAIGSGVTVFDEDEIPLGDRIESATITLTDRVAGDTLTLTGALPGGFTAVTTPAVGTITIQITGSGTGAQYQALIESIQYATTNQDPTVGNTDLARTVTVTVNDGDISSVVATATINITAIDDLPVAQADAFTINENGSIVGGNLFANNGAGADTDPDGPPLAISAVNGSGANVGSQITLASGAHLTVNANGTFDYDPGTVFLPTPTLGSGASNTPGLDSFTYTLSGGNTVTVSITLTGLDTDDLLLGFAGNDILIGGTGNDLYRIEDSGDQIVENVGEGFDAAYVALGLGSYTLNAGAEVELLSAIDPGSSAAFNLTGNEFGNTLIGTAGANVLIGGGGNDALAGLGGNDAYRIEDAGDLILETAGNGVDSAYVVASVGSYTLQAGTEVELLSAIDPASSASLNLTGNEINNVIIGTAGANVLIGGGGNDTLIGLGGNDIYRVEDAGDVVLENAGGGFDAIYVVNALGSYTLQAGTEVELVSAIDPGSTAAFDLTGNEFANTLIGTAGANVLIGGGGNDVLAGLGGNDIYRVEDAGDIVLESGGGGTDSVYVATAVGSYTLQAGTEVELLSAVDPSSTGALNLTGNEYNNTIYGNDGANVLDGKGGNDALVGLLGADTFQFTTALGAGNVDIIFGFDHGVDRIALDDAIFTAIGPLGTLNANAFVVGNAAADASDRIIYNSLTGQLLYDADGNGAGAAVLFATMSPGLTITASDFTVI